jgi:hypothetical protein
MYESHREFVAAADSAFRRGVRRWLAGVAALLTLAGVSFTFADAPVLSAPWSVRVGLIVTGLFLIEGLIRPTRWRHTAYIAWGMATLAATIWMSWPPPTRVDGSIVIGDIALPVAIVTGIVVAFGIALFRFDPPAT